MVKKQPLYPHIPKTKVTKVSTVTNKITTKEPWMMTREEWIKDNRGNPELHKLIVEEKLKFQTPRTRNVVPPEVLKDYPELAKRKLF